MVINSFLTFIISRKNSTNSTHATTSTETYKSEFLTQKLLWVLTYDELKMTKIRIYRTKSDLTTKSI